MGPGFEVTPTALWAPAAQCGNVAATLARIRTSLRAGAPSTGRPDTTELLASFLGSMARDVDTLGRAALADADDLRAAAAAYQHAETTAVRHP